MLIALTVLIALLAVAYVLPGSAKVLAVPRMQTAAAHFGPDHDAGRRRLAFDELLIDQIVQLRLRRERRADIYAAPLADPPSLSAQWRATALPFVPTVTMSPVSTPRQPASSADSSSSGRGRWNWSSETRSTAAPEKSGL